ncbi:MAG: hypothetical protein P8N76_24290 [Pirellulaceae bacterium]|nr:hypothetical protein [Pirellulaceae bacterium]
MNRLPFKTLERSWMSRFDLNCATINKLRDQPSPNRPSPHSFNHTPFSDANGYFSFTGSSLHKQRDSGNGKNTAKQLPAKQLPATLSSDQPFAEAN